MSESGNDYVPLFQSMLWLLAIFVALIVLRPELRLIRKAVVDRLESGDALKLGPLELERLNQKIDMVQDEVSQLFLLTMSKPCYTNLRRLSSDVYGQYTMNGGLERELRHLRNLGYITVDSVGALPADGDQLSDFVRVTAAGKKFVDLRERAEHFTADL